MKNLYQLSLLIQSRAPSHDTIIDVVVDEVAETCTEVVCKTDGTEDVKAEDNTTIVTEETPPSVAHSDKIYFDSITAKLRYLLRI
jgi:hypothetical protein